MQAVELSKTKKHALVDTIHFLKVLFESDVLDGLYKRLHINKQEALVMIDDELNKVAISEGSEPRLSNEVVTSFEKAQKWSEENDESYLGCASFWIALMFNNSYISKLLVKRFL